LAYKLVNKNSGFIRQLYRKKINPDGTESKDVETLYWIDGNLKTMELSDEIETAEHQYEKDDNKILVSNSRG